MLVNLQYGRTGLALDLPDADVTVIEPRHLAGVAPTPQAEAAAFRDALRAPIVASPLGASPPLRELVGPADRVAIVIPDATRALPTARLLPVVLEELAHVPAAQVTIITGTGTHRANTPEELAAMVGPEVLARYRVVNHDASDPTALALAGASPEGWPVHLARDYVAADRRIVLGFIEPHFMAGFSGGYKGVFPAIADLGAIMRYHRASVIGDPASTWGRLEGNPTQALVRACGSLLPVDFLVNVTLNRAREVTRFFCGEVASAHAAGCEFARATAMIECPRDYPIVITTNSGYPLDQNLYQGVKGISAAAQIVAPGGLIISACECSDGFPAHGAFREWLMAHDSPEALLRAIETAPEPRVDQWTAQLLALIQLRARVAVHSLIDPDELRRAHLEPVADIAARVREELARLGPDAPIAVLPEGPMTIPYLASPVPAASATR